jgi:hypothetical protein
MTPLEPQKRSNRLAFGVPVLLTASGILLLNIQGITLFAVAALALGIITGLITWLVRRL